jgi:NADH-quinone oxidoreductase subunit M
MTVPMLLLVLVFAPVGFSLVLALCAGRRNLAQQLNVVFASLWALACLLLARQLSVGGAPLADFSPQVVWNWLPAFRSAFSLGIDGLSFPLVGLHAFLVLVLGLYFLGKEKVSSGFLSLFWILNGASVGSLLATDAITFYVFWEFMLIPMFFMIGRWGSKQRVYASLKFFAFTMAGSLLMLAAIVGISFSSGDHSLQWSDLIALRLPFDGPLSPQGLAFLGFAAAFLVKIPMWPLHSWLPDAHTEAPTGASVILAGVLLKLGVYGLVRWTLPLFPEATEWYSPAIMTLACVGIVLGAFAAWKQSDIKKIIAYSSVSHLGFMVLGVFALRLESIQGALFQNLAHGLSTGLLFLVFGMIYDRTHTREVSSYSGLATVNPFLASAFVLASLSSIGLPGLPGFVGEFLVMSGSFMSSPVHACIALSGVLLGGVYTLTLVRALVFGQASTTLKEHPIVVSIPERVAVVMMLVVTLFFGFFPQKVFVFGAESIQKILAFFG